MDASDVDATQGTVDFDDGLMAHDEHLLRGLLGWKSCLPK